jgi:hypothetical protein
MTVVKMKLKMYVVIGSSMQSSAPSWDVVAALEPNWDALSAAAAAAAADVAITVWLRFALLLPTAFGP